MIIHEVLSSFIFPPGVVILLLFFGFIASFHFRRLGVVLIGFSLLLLYFCSSPIVARLLAEPLEQNTILKMSVVKRILPQSIVVLAGGVNIHAPEYNGCTLSKETEMRIRYAAQLYTRFQLPVLVSGGVSTDQCPAVAQLMARDLELNFHTPVKWIQDKSRTTEEDAKYSSIILQKEGIKNILLVTTAIHIPRAVWSFHRLGFNVIPAGTDYIALGGKLFWINFSPSAEALLNIVSCLHEYVGNLWYHFRYS